MLQWVRGHADAATDLAHGTGRIEASVSLVDGPVLDGWTLGGTDSARIAKPRPPG